MTLRSAILDDLTIIDERSFRHVALYADLKQIVRRSGYQFHILPKGSPSAFWDRALFLNLTFWNASEAGDVLVDDTIPADVVAHVGWHHLAKWALTHPVSTPARAPSAEGLFLGESIASAFDLYLVGRLLGHAPSSEFLETQVPAMASVAESAGLSDEAFESLLSSVADSPDNAFEELRQLLFDAALALFRCHSVTEGATALAKFEGHRFGALLHHYELSTWVLYAKAYASKTKGEPCDAETAIAIDADLRHAPLSLDWLTEHWIEPNSPR